MVLERILVSLLAAVIVGGLMGMIPFLLGRYMGRCGLGNLGLLCCVLSALLFLWLPAFVAVGFAVFILVAREDYHRPGAPRRLSGQSGGDGANGIAPVAQGIPAVGTGGGLYVSCLSGPLRGQVYPVGQEGLMIGRGAECGIRFPEGSPGISGRHCQLRWQQGVLVLSDLGSTYGTFLGDGRKLPPNYPMQLVAGSRFYLANVGCLFQIVVM